MRGWIETSSCQLWGWTVNRQAARVVRPVSLQWARREPMLWPMVCGVLVTEPPQQKMAPRWKSNMEGTSNVWLWLKMWDSQIAVFCRRIMMNHSILSYTLRQAHVLLRKGTWTHNPTANMQINRSGTSNCCGLKSDSKPWQGRAGPNSQTIDNNCRCPENANCHPAHNLKISKDLQNTRA